VRVEINDKGQVSGKYYSGVHWDTVEATILGNGSATLTIRYLHLTKAVNPLQGLELEPRRLQIKEESRN
jgi:hypothetical protein